MEKNTIRWVICLLEAGSGRPVLVSEGMEIDADDPAYERDVHIVPCRLEGDEHVFGVHELERACCCHPEIRHKDNGRTQVIHSEKVN